MLRLHAANRKSIAKNMYGCGVVPIHYFSAKSLARSETRSRTSATSRHAMAHAATTPKASSCSTHTDTAFRSFLSDSISPLGEPSARVVRAFFARAQPLAESATRREYPTHPLPHPPPLLPPLLLPLLPPPPSPPT